jgi:hypothetical protein
MPAPVSRDESTRTAAACRFATLARCGAFFIVHPKRLSGRHRDSRRSYKAYGETRQAGTCPACRGFQPCAANCASRCTATETVG